MFEHLMDVTVDGSVEWGPDPAEVEDLAEILAEAGDDPDDQARAALVWMHTREAAQ